MHLKLYDDSGWLEKRTRKRRVLHLIFTGRIDGLTSTPVSSVKRQATLMFAIRRSETLRAYLFILDSASMGHFHILAFVPLTLLVRHRVKYNQNVRSLVTLRV